jgi:hypothetical protein
MLTTYLCPQGHNSSEADYCSECGTKIQGLGITPVSPETICPSCSTLHNPDEGPFCGICGYNFITGAQGLPPQSEPQPIPPAVLSPNWTVVISVDPVQRDPISPPAPDLAPITLALPKSVNLIGRTSQARAIYPEISLDFDDAVSQRHGLLTIQADGSLMFRDIGSSNGTCLNGVEVTVMADLPLKNGDQLTLGHWTKLSICSS